MREILFRGKKVNKDKWIYGVPLKGTPDDETETIIIESVFCCEEYFCRGCNFDPVIPETVEQFTGLTDKNGKKIFEGDIVKYTRKNMYAPETSFHKQDLVSIHIIEWDNKDCMFEQKHYSLESKRIIGSGGLPFEDDRANENIIEVIGNIHDNPELLEV